MTLVLMLYMLLASTFTLGKAVLSYIQPIFFIGLRMVLGGLLLFVFMYFFKKEWLRLNKRDWPLFVLITIFHIYLAYILEFVGLQDISSAKACLLYNVSPFLTALFSYFYFGEKMTSNKWVGLSIGFMGLMPTLMLCQGSGGISFLCITVPELLLLGSVVSSVQGWLVMKRLIRGEGYSPVMVNAVGMVSGGVLALITSLFVETGARVYPIPHAWLMVFVYTALLILIANVIFYNLYGFLLHRYSATFLSFAGFTCPLFAAVYGKIFLGEDVSVWFIVSVIAIIAGLFLFYREELKIMALKNKGPH